MSWSRRSVILAALALAACGFSPVYGPGGTGGKLFGQVRAADPRTPDDFSFAGRIAERLGSEAGGASCSTTGCASRWCRRRSPPTR